MIFVDAGKPEWQLPDFNSEEIARVCLYFFQIPRCVSNNETYSRVPPPSCLVYQLQVLNLIR